MRLILRVALLALGISTIALTAPVALARRSAATPPSAWIAFVLNDYGTATLYRARTVGGLPLPVMLQASSLSAPDWSPDGQWLAFSASFNDGFLALYRVRPDGHDLTRITPATYQALAPDWSPGGAWVVFVAAAGSVDATTSIARIRRDGSAYETLAAAPDGEGYRTPTWSPDGEWIAFTRLTGEGASHIMVMRADGRDLRVLVSDFGSNRAPHWSPDGAWIAYLATSVQSQMTRTYRIPAAGGEHIPVSPPAARAVAPAWSPDGAWIMFALSTPHGNNLYRVHPDGSGLEQFIDFPYAVQNPTWGPPVDVPFRPGISLSVGMACFVAAYFSLSRSKHP